MARITHDPVPDSGRVWAAISALATRTGLQPVLLADPEPEELFQDPPDITQPDGAYSH